VEKETYTLLLCVVLGLAPLSARAQATRVGAIRPQPRASILGTLTVTASPAAVSFALVSKGVASASSAVAVTTTYSGISLLGSLVLYGYFSSSTAALSGGSPVASIPSSAILGQCTTGSVSTFTSFTQTTPFSGASGLELFTQSSILSLHISRTDNLSLKIDLTGLPQQPAAIYSGVLLLQAQAF
jgi:hypothetical protein